jgi:hypothetical protein
MVEQRIVREDAQTRNLQKPRGAMRVMHGFHGTYRPGSRLRSGLPFGGFDAESKRLSETCGRMTEVDEGVKTPEHREMLHQMAESVGVLGQVEGKANGTRIANF